jgi:hypothetical protein
MDGTGIIMLSEVIQVQKDKVSPHMWTLDLKDKCVYVCIENMTA